MLVRFAPFQLAAQNFEVGFLGWLDEFQPLCGAGDADKIRWLQWDTTLTVEGQKNGVSVSGELHLHGRRVADYQWAVTQDVRTDGRDYKGFHGGMHDGSASRERIGRRTSRAGHNEAVGAVAADKIPVNGELKLDHAGERALIDHQHLQHEL